MEKGAVLDGVVGLGLGYGQPDELRALNKHL
jgi:hypothetical protein